MIKHQEAATFSEKSAGRQQQLDLSREKFAPRQGAKLATAGDGLLKSANFIG
jgi:hypothetical protein